MTDSSTGGLGVFCSNLEIYSHINQLIHLYDYMTVYGYNCEPINIYCTRIQRDAKSVQLCFVIV
jgi:hypothetical protein